MSHEHTHPEAVGNGVGNSVRNGVPAVGRTPVGPVDGTKVPRYAGAATFARIPEIQAREYLHHFAVGNHNIGVALHCFEIPQRETLAVLVRDQQVASLLFETTRIRRR